MVASDMTSSEEQPKKAAPETEKQPQEAPAATPKSQKSAGNPPRASSRKKKRRKKRGQRQPSWQEQWPAFGQVLKGFVNCGRCSFFLAGYRVIHGMDSLEAAAKERDETGRGAWLDLFWNADTARLVQGSYGGQLDSTCYHYEGYCQECRRCFIYSEAAEAGEPATFRMEVKLP